VHFAHRPQLHRTRIDRALHRHRSRTRGFSESACRSSGDALWVSREWRPNKRTEQLLLSYGGKPTKGHTGKDWPKEAPNWLRVSPVHEAARKGDVREAKKLLKAGADPTARDEHLRSTPLAWAAKFGQLTMVKFLLRHGAPKNLPDDPPWATPLAWAIRRGHDEIAKLLS
jgi:ankyrin repeat protein